MSKDDATYYADAEILSYSTSDGVRTHDKSVHEGYFQKNEDGFSFVYTDYPDPSDQSQVRKSTLSVKKNAPITLLHEGACQAKLTFEEGKKHPASYETQFGTVRLVVHTKKTAYSTEAMKHIVQLHYHLFTGDHELSEHHIKIVIKKRKDVP